MESPAAAAWLSAVSFASTLLTYSFPEEILLRASLGNQRQR